MIVIALIYVSQGEVIALISDVNGEINEKNC